ncbi:MAG: hypothetical protein LBL94_00430 [Prevotellaceae bacterium]|jgi:hypothetical protein|nr:hypothetical protein [Prevotellaceae bacterium]
MRTISVQISDLEYSAFGLSKKDWSFSELTNLIEKNLAQQALDKAAFLAEQNGLSSMTMADILDEVKAARKCKK